MKELQIETHNLARDWEALLIRILAQEKVGRAAGTRPDEEPADEDEWAMYRSLPDLTFTPNAATTTLAVEFKMFRWQTDWRRRVRDAIAHTHEVIKTNGLDGGIVIVSLDLPEEILAELKSPAAPDVEIWGLAKLRSLAAYDDELANELEELVSETVLDGDSGTRTTPETESLTGTKIAARLRQVPPGKEGWTEFEKYCEQAIRFLFAAELSNLKAQQRTDDQLNRMDLIGRIKSDRGSFWSMIATDFSSRYVVFDAKNYRDPIGQREVEITEKYLFDKGLRTVAIVVARSGANASARKSAEALLREYGKLILVIDLEDLCRMLTGADAGDPPENLLFERMDEMLMTMGR
ncbi:restriction endonuclease [Mesorhizobium sp. STM 4661]|uniref:restriction endonuclease n=1 Tax=Mesorhizobium sp. STM 4661 TaxID=1297570 RepID=UPI0012FCDF95|nr:restriction endonuclease [Mesorhizobium sp. STM 4661]